MLVISSMEIQLECGQRSDRLLSARRFKRFLSQSYIGFLHSQSGNILVVSIKLGGCFSSYISVPNILTNYLIYTGAYFK